MFLPILPSNQDRQCKLPALPVVLKVSSLVMGILTLRKALTLMTHRVPLEGTQHWWCLVFQGSTFGWMILSHLYTASFLNYNYTDYDVYLYVRFVWFCLPMVVIIFRKLFFNNLILCFLVFFAQKGLGRLFGMCFSALVQTILDMGPASVRLPPIILLVGPPCLEKSVGDTWCWHLCVFIDKVTFRDYESYFQTIGIIKSEALMLPGAGGPRSKWGLWTVRGCKDWKKSHHIIPNGSKRSFCKGL